MRGRVRRELRVGGQRTFGFEAADCFAVSVVGVPAHHLDGGHLLPGPQLRPSLQVGGVSAVEHVDDLPGVRVDRGGDEPAPAEPCRGAHDGLVEPQAGRRPDPVRVAGRLLERRLDRRPNGVTSHAQIAGQRRHRRAHRRLHSPAGEHPARPGQPDLLGPCPGIAPPVRARPDALVPQNPHRHPASRRSVAQNDPAPTHGPGPAPARAAALNPPAGRLHLHHLLPGLDALGDNRQPECAKTHNRNSLNHQGPPDSLTI